ncbi:unnamed protein product [Amoebophrya sp. A25]|nr:unnamed protein product [Amoebophrya sp. A25]|eukprot:GSA25T00013292001.1
MCTNMLFSSSSVLLQRAAPACTTSLSAFAPWRRIRVAASRASPTQERYCRHYVTALAKVSSSECFQFFGRERFFTSIAAKSCCQQKRNFSNTTEEPPTSWVPGKKYTGTCSKVLRRRSIGFVNPDDKNLLQGQEGGKDGIVFPLWKLAEGSKIPRTGDHLAFQIRPSPKFPGRLEAHEVAGGTSDREFFSRDSAAAHNAVQQAVAQSAYS